MGLLYFVGNCHLKGDVCLGDTYVFKLNKHKVRLFPFKKACIHRNDCTIFYVQEKEEKCFKFHEEFKTMPYHKFEGNKHCKMLLIEKVTEVDPSIFE